MPHHNSHYYEFGPYRLDVGQRVLTRTAKDELLQQVWPDTFVEESNLTKNIFLLRRVLGDERPTPRYIETVLRRGYRFIANVRVIGTPDFGDSNESKDPCYPRDPRFTVTGSGSEYSNGDDTAAPPTVAVLPFLNATGNDDLEYLVDGLTEKRLLRPRLFFEALSDNVRHAQVNETLTRLYIASGDYLVAERTIDDALQTLELTDGEAVLTEALTTSGIVAFSGSSMRRHDLRAHESRGTLW